MQNSTTIGFIGAGNMAYAIISGLINKGTNANQIKISDTNDELLSLRKQEFNLEVFTDNTQLVANCDVLVLAVKPQVLFAVCDAIKDHLKSNTLIVSIAAGVKSHDINRWLGGNQSIVRSMPNTPALLNQGVTGLFANDATTQIQKDLAQNILDAVGESLWVDNETLLDAVTALSGSGPAYFFLMIDSMSKAGVALGLDKETAQKLSIKTALGSAIMADQSEDSPRELRAKVTSPNGTTQAAIESFQDQDFDVIVSHAMRAAFDRANELGVKLGESISE